MVQGDVGRAGSVDQLVAVQHRPQRMTGHQEQGEITGAFDFGTHHPVVGAGAVEDPVLDAGQAPAIGHRTGLGSQLEVVLVAHLLLLVRQRQYHFASGYLAEQPFAQLGVVADAQQASAEHGGVHQWLGHQAASQLFHQQSQIMAAAAQAAELLGNVQGQPAHFGEGVPVLA
ncbi:hypothetical protein D9M68_422280 [compost metagenome]